MIINCSCGDNDDDYDNDDDGVDDEKGVWW